MVSVLCSCTYTSCTPLYTMSILCTKEKINNKSFIIRKKVRSSAVLRLYALLWGAELKIIIIQEQFGISFWLTNTILQRHPGTEHSAQMKVLHKSLTIFVLLDPHLQALFPVKRRFISLLSSLYCTDACWQRTRFYVDAANFFLLVCSPNSPHYILSCIQAFELDEQIDHLPVWNAVQLHFKTANQQGIIAAALQTYWSNCGEKTDDVAPLKSPGCFSYCHHAFATHTSKNS